VVAYGGPPRLCGGPPSHLLTKTKQQPTASQLRFNTPRKKLCCLAECQLKASEFVPMCTLGGDNVFT